MLTVPPLFAKVKNHLEKILGQSMVFMPFPSDGQLPMYLIAAYDLQRTTLLGVPCLVMFDKSKGNWTPAAVAKHAHTLRQITNLIPIFVAVTCSLQERQRLINQHVGFVIPGNQVFLPSLGLDLNERVRRAPKEVTKFSPATQVLVLKALTSGQTELSPSKTAATLGYSVMTLTRAFNELETCGLARCRQQGRQRILEFTTDGFRELWDKAKPLFRSPVKTRVWILGKTDLKGSRAGLSALAELTNLVPPQSPCQAVSRGIWRNWMIAHSKTVLSREDPEAAEVQVWWYPPEKFSNAGRVDSFSLYLSLRPGQDERVEQALEQLEKTLW